MPRDSDPISDGRTEVEALQSAVDVLRKQRDEARAQRDLAKKQRDEARQQRDHWRGRSAAAERITTAPAPKATSAKATAATTNPNPAAVKRGLSHSVQNSARNDLITVGDAYALEAERRSSLREVTPTGDAGRTSAHDGVHLKRSMPVLHKRAETTITPGPEIAFVTIANHAFMPGLTALILSLIEVYPSFESTLYVYHDGSLTEYDKFCLRSLYEGIAFEQPDMSWLDVPLFQNKNRARIGKLGYMKFAALQLSNFERVVVLDSDLLIINDISALWIGDDSDFRVSHDFGDQDYVVVSKHTGVEIFNSGVISIPHAALSMDKYEIAKRTVIESIPPFGDAIDRFADQKAWNMFLVNETVTELPANYNCNVKYIGRYLGGNTEHISIIHFAGPKPWEAGAMPKSFGGMPKSRSARYPSLWLDRVRPLLFQNRAMQFQRATAADRRVPVRPTSRLRRRTCAFIEDINSAQLTRSLQDNAELFWFMNDQTEAMTSEAPASPEHVVLGWTSFDVDARLPASPRLTASHRQFILAMTDRPVLWAPFGAKYYFDNEAAFGSYEINYFLQERPFSSYVDVVGTSEFDLRGFLDNARLDCLSYGIPIAGALGFEDIVVVNHGRPLDISRIPSCFMSGVAEPSAVEPPCSPERFQFVAQLAEAQLRRKGVRLYDASENGVLKIPRWLEPTDRLRIVSNSQ